MTAFANVYVGAAPNDLTGDPLRNAFQKINLNFANITSGNANVTVNSPVRSVAGRTGNVVLTVNDVLGVASNAWVNAQTNAANVYANLLYFTTTSNITANVYAQVSANLSSNIAQTASDLVNSGNLLLPVYANINSTNANVTAANARISLLSANVGGVNNSVSLLVAANVVTDANLGTQSLRIGSLEANAATQSADISTNTNRVTAANARIATLDANLGTATTNISTLLANAATQAATLDTLTANAVTQANSLATLTANAVTQANTLAALTANAATQDSSLSLLQSNSVIQGSQINILDANLGTATTNITTLLANAATQATTLVDLAGNDTVQGGQIRTLDANLGVATTNIGINTGAIFSLNANLTATNLAVVTANLAMKSYVDGQVAFLTSNAGTQASSINTINANLGTATNNITTLFTNAISQTFEIVSLQANITAANASQLANNVTQSQQIQAVNANINQANVEINNLRANITAANATTQSLITLVNANVSASNAKLAPISNIEAIYGNLIPLTSNIYSLGKNGIKWNEIWTGGNINTTSYLQAGVGLQAPVVSTGNLQSNTALVYFEAIVGNLRTVDDFGVANIGNIITTAGVFWSNGAEYGYSNISVSTYLQHLNTNVIPLNDDVYTIGRANLQVKDMYLSNALVIGGEVITVSGQQISINGAPLSANTGNIAFSGTTITTDAGAGTGIILNSAGAGEIAMQDYVGINNTNPGYWLHIGDGAPGAVHNTGNISIDYNNGLDTRRGSTIISYAWWDAASNGNDNRGTGVHTHFGIYKNDDTFDNKFLEFEYTSGNANVGNLTATSLTVLTNVAYTMANYQNWTSNVSTVGAALDQLAQRLKDAGF
jgi:hypothetical protein